jgi:protein tyrosine/serine phosphatase
MIAIMKKRIALILVFLLSLCMIQTMAEAAAIGARVVEIDEYGHAHLDITKADFTRAGFNLGDIVTVTCGDYIGDMPVFSGYYADRENCILRVNPYKDALSLCINYGNFSEMTGIGVGDAVTIAMKEKYGAMATQELYGLSYSDDRADFASDAVFANFRSVAEGKLYRSASPIDNKAKRAHYADRLIQEAGVQTVMNMANTPETIAALIAAEDFDSPYYRNLFEAGKVFALKMSVDFASEAFAADIVKGFSFLAEGDMPYLVHCLEGKDRTGFAIVVLEALMGWNEKRIVGDYMQTYTNYYGIEPGTKKYDMTSEKNITEMLYIIAGLESGTSLVEIDLKTAAETYLLNNGMDKEALKLLEAKLTSEHTR